MINTRTHGILDYIMGIALIIVPILFDFGSVDPAAFWVPVIVGIVGLLTSVMTRYELGLVKVLPMPAHLGADIVAGAILAASPWIFGFADTLWIPHLVLGLLEVGLAVLTQRHSSVGTATAAR